ncbi:MULTISPECIES: hypothetical protein [unclassified Bartonella]|uniref:hypothetical protein n=1 Tax=unclassified Bartonella TaxID=2645622 RepID=UPI0035CE9986
MRFDVNIKIKAIFTEKNSNETFIFKNNKLLNKCFDKAKFIDLLRDKMGNNIMSTLES